MLIILLFIIILAITGTLSAFCGQVGAILGFTALTMFYVIAFELHVVVAFIAALASILAVAFIIDWCSNSQHR